MECCTIWQGHISQCSEFYDRHAFVLELQLCGIYVTYILIKNYEWLHLGIVEQDEYRTSHIAAILNVNQINTCTDEPHGQVQINARPMLILPVRD